LAWIAVTGDIDRLSGSGDGGSAGLHRVGRVRRREEDGETMAGTKSVHGVTHDLLHSPGG
jgi:hypothetical protein